ncbi:MAG: hypothetical protein KGI41_00320 [Patescibacteria group bacterium]|nr:hypothetical protein [Patescibacteria group bacterium]MDE1965676.1 hypothetical protein [Patescibacteria group bacterium]
MPIARTLNQDFFKKWTPEMAYVLGYFAADGSMIRHQNRGCFIEFTSTDKSLLATLRHVAGAGQRIATRKRRSRNWQEQYRIQIGSKEWFTDLTKLGFAPAKSTILTFPSAPNAYLAHFVRGYFDGDGCVYFRKLQYADRTRKRWVLMSLFTSGSRDFLESLWIVLKTNGVSGGTIQPKTRGFELKFSHRDSLALYRFMYDTASATEPYLPRKRTLFRKAIRTLYPELRG